MNFLQVIFSVFQFVFLMFFNSEWRKEYKAECTADNDIYSNY